jgi:site-specific DNA-methyltransferase (adenine-specific)/modification methylase
MIELNKIYNEDCRNTMLKMSDNSVDLILTDPPYNAKDIGPNKRKYNTGTMQLPLEEYIQFCKGWFKEADRVSKRIVFTPGIANICYYPQPSWVACWHKPAACSFNRFGGFNAWEPIMLYGKIPKGNKLRQDYILFNTLNFKKGPEEHHPCPKPLGLIEILITIFSLENDIVFDPFIGSGTTAVAAIKHNRKFIGSELSKEYCDIANKRIKTELSQMKLF